MKAKVWAGSIIIVLVSIALSGVAVGQRVYHADNEWDVLKKKTKTIARTWEEVEWRYEQGEYFSAVHLATYALHVAEENLDPNHPDVARSLNNLALLHYVLGQYEQAEPLYKRALAIREEALGPDHLDVAASLDNLAELYTAQGQPEQAEPLYERALAIREKPKPEADTSGSLNYSPDYLLHRFWIVSGTLAVYSLCWILFLYLSSRASARGGVLRIHELRNTLRQEMAEERAVAMGLAQRTAHMAEQLCDASQDCHFRYRAPTETRGDHPLPACGRPWAGFLVVIGVFTCVSWWLEPHPLRTVAVLIIMPYVLVPWVSLKISILTRERDVRNLVIDLEEWISASRSIQSAAEHLVQQPVTAIDFVNSLELTDMPSSHNVWRRWRHNRILAQLPFFLILKSICEGANIMREVEATKEHIAQFRRELEKSKGAGPCATCRGSGKVKDSWTCNKCNGQGSRRNYDDPQVWRDWEAGGVDSSSLQRCKRCGGTGTCWIDVRCEICDGTGRIPLSPEDEQKVKYVAERAMAALRIVAKRLVEGGQGDENIMPEGETTKEHITEFRRELENSKGVDPCTTCGGRGEIEHSRTCPKCKGQGSRRNYDDPQVLRDLAAGGVDSSLQPCRTCDGTGAVPANEPCAGCDGTGRISLPPQDE